MKIYKYIIVLSFLGLWLNSFIPSEYLYILGLVLILTFGILHGANDIVIIHRSYKALNINNIYSTIIFYLVIVGLFAVFFVFVPDFALLTFILISAYHFGEQHWHLILKSTNQILSGFFEFIYGCLIFCLIFYFHQSEVENIINDICGYYISLDFLKYMLAALCTSVFVISLYLNKANRLFRLQLTEQLLYILVLAIIFRVTDLIWSFAIYFVLWHSVPSLKDQLEFIYGNANKKSIIKYFKQAVWYWIASIIGLSVFYWFLKDTKVFEALLFSFIAAITFPHVLVISKMFKKKNS
jgi:Brp/Blh family beta-carotene 15,15'-monooxygenase